MNLKDFLKDRADFIAIQAGALLLIGFILYLVDFNIYINLFVLEICLLADVGVLALEFVRKCRYYDDVLSKLDGLDKKYLLSEIIGKPVFLDGAILYETLRETNKDMNDEIAKYKAASQEYREYIETWVHEVKTPIASSKLIIENNKNSVTQSIGEEISKIELFVEQALFYSRSNSVEKDYIIKEISLRDVVNGAVKRNAKELINNHVNVELHDLDYDVFCDAKWVGFILEQLIVNAVKYRGKQPRVMVFAEEHPNNICLYVRDNGIGISEKDVPRVFDKGFTGENGRIYGASTGIGLYLCRKLCGKLGLKISLTSVLGQGTTIEIVFPKGKMMMLS